MAQPCAFLLQPALHRIGQSQPGLLAATRQGIQACLRTQRVQAQEGAVDALRALAQGIALLRRATGDAGHADACQQVGPIRHQQFGGGRRRGRAQVGGEIGQGEVGLVADRGDHRHRAAAIARTRPSSLNAHRSSSEPPPRASTITS
jgi:hypothetical protein